MDGLPVLLVDMTAWAVLVDSRRPDGGLERQHSICTVRCLSHELLCFRFARALVMTHYHISMFEYVLWGDLVCSAAKDVTARVTCVNVA